jgi:hypothetical protein
MNKRSVRVTLRLIIAIKQVHLEHKPNRLRLRHRDPDIANDPVQTLVAWVLPVHLYRFLKVHLDIFVFYHPFRVGIAGVEAADFIGDVVVDGGPGVEFDLNDEGPGEDLAGGDEFGGFVEEAAVSHVWHCCFSGGSVDDSGLCGVETLGETLAFWRRKPNVERPDFVWEIGL